MKNFTIAASVLALCIGVGRAEPVKQGIYTFSTLKAPAAETVRDQALAWLKGTAKADEVTLAKAKEIWSANERLVLDRVTDTIALALPEAGKILETANDESTPAPKEMPALLKDTKLPAFVRSNLALAYGRGLSSKRVYEDALEALKLAVPEQVCDPAAYYFHKAVAEHALIQKQAALLSITRLIDDVADAPERYKMVAILMFVDMQQWKDDQKDLENIARLMDNVERRLDQSRGGPQTQELQKKIVFRLDEVIKEIENQIKNGGGMVQCPGGDQQPGQGNTNQPQMPQDDSRPGTNGGPGMVDPKKLKHLAEVWGKLPEKERAAAMMEITKDLPPRYREVIENYFKTLAKTPAP